MKRMFKYITNTRIAQQLNLQQSMKIVVEYLAGNRNVIANPEDLTSIFSTRSFTSTPISMFFDKCVVSQHLNEFATIADPSRSVIEGIPDALTMPSCVIDLEQTPSGEILSGYKELHRKIVLNITNLVKRTNAGLQVSALHELHSMYTKALLVRSYFRSGASQWLSPIMQQFVIRTYSQFIGSIIANQANLNIAESNQVASIFALYMCQMLSDDRSNLTIPPQFLNLTFLGNRSDLLYITEECSDYTKDGLDLQKCCDLVAKFGPARLSDYSIDAFYRHCSTLGPYNDAISTYMAFDYPPYWVWLILMSLSGAQMGRMSKLLQQFNLKQAGMKFAHDLISYPALIER